MKVTVMYSHKVFRNVDIEIPDDVRFSEGRILTPMDFINEIYSPEIREKLKELFWGDYEIEGYSHKFFQGINAVKVYNSEGQNIMMLYCENPDIKEFIKNKRNSEN